MHQSRLKQPQVQCPQRPAPHTYQGTIMTSKLAYCSGLILAGLIALSPSVQAEGCYAALELLHTPQQRSLGLGMLKGLAENQDPCAQYEYAKILEQGLYGIAPNLQAAKQWYWEAAQQGSKAAIARYKQLQP